MRLPEKSPFLPSSSIDIQRFGKPDPSALRVYVFADVLDEIIFHATYRQEAAATLLTGGAYRGPAGLYIEITGFAEAAYVDDVNQFRRSLHGSYRPVHAALRRDDPTVFVLGWSYGVRGSGGVMTTDQLRLHLTFFNLEHQVFLSVDPESQAFGFFHRAEDGTLENIGFNLVSPIDAAGRRSTDNLKIVEAAQQTDAAVEAENIAETLQQAPEPAIEEPVLDGTQSDAPSVQDGA